MKKLKAFTLVELLVVISIISLLMSIMMPALGKVRRKAQNVLGQMNQHQWTTMFMMYADDYEGHMPMGWTTVPPFEVKGMWQIALRSYYDIGEIRCCPTANKKFRSDDSSPLNAVYVGWGVWGEGEQEVVPSWADEGDYGSYGVNAWCHDPPIELLESWNPEAVAHKVRYWRTIGVQGGNEIPLFGDASWDGSGPDPQTNSPMAFPGMDGGKGNGMANFALPRHSDKTNLAFLDLSVRNVKIKELWELKWHRDSRPATHPWPDWIEELE